MSARLLIHVGYHKTATTWMQQLLFTPDHGFRQIAGHREVFDHIVGPHGLEFDADSIRPLITAAVAGLAPGEVPVISSEILSGHPFFGGIDSDVYAARLKAIAPDARILVSIRAQERILPSVYMQYLLRGGTMTPRQFFGGATELGYFGFRAAHFEYDRLIGHYQSLFGADSVHVMTQESLKADMDGAAAALARFCENGNFRGLRPEARKVHAASYPEYAVPVLRRVNHVQKSVLNPNPIIPLGTTPRGLYRAFGYVLRRQPFKAMLSGYQPVTQHVRAAFRGRYAASNARLAAMLGPETDLSDYT